MSQRPNGAQRNNAANAPTSRAKPVPAGDEEASATLNLGEFQDVEPLTLSAAGMIIGMVLQRRPPNAEKNEILKKTLVYLDNFARFPKPESVSAVDRILMAQVDLHPFERAQLGNLCCADAEEAKTLIPSITDKISDEDLDDLLEELARLR